MKLLAPYRSLRSQVSLWVILPVIIVLMVFSIGGVNSYDNAMRTLAIEDERRLAVALAGLISIRLDNYALRSGLPRSEVTINHLEPEKILRLYHTEIDSTLVLFDSSGTILYGSGLVPPQENLLEWPGVAQALQGEIGTLVANDSGYGDLIAYAPVRNTDWYLIIRESWYVLIEPLVRLDQMMAFVLISAGLVSLLILIFGIRYIARPLRELSLRAQRIGQGQFDAAAKPVGGVREIEDLRETLYDMAQRVAGYQGALQDYLRAVTQAQEEERARLARELHDVTIQTLIALGHKAQMIQRSLGRDTAQTQERTGEMRRMIAEAIEEVRRFSQALHPHYLEELGLVTALEILCEEAEVQYTTFGQAARLLPEQELVVYRIAQEALNNARRHARAQKIRIDLYFAPEHITLHVIDDGIGFEMPSQFNSLTRTGHFGLVGMRERAQLVGGQLHIQSAPHKGTRIIFSVSR